METWSILALISILQIVTAADIPAKLPAICTDPALFTKNPRKCCNIPNIFENSVFTDCGYKKIPEGETPDTLTNIGRLDEADCHKTICVLEKYNMTTPDKMVDAKKFAVEVDNWAEINKDWKTTIEKVKEKCLHSELPNIPDVPDVCNPRKIMYCATQTLIEYCPVWEKSEECDNMKKQIEQCQLKS